MTRSEELLLDIATHFENQSAIAHSGWLREKDVTITEIDDLFNTASLLLEGYAKASKAQKRQILIQAACAVGKYRG